MKKKVSTIICLVVTLAVLVAVPVLAWFTEQDGFKVVVTDYPNVTAREDSVFSLSYGSSSLDSSTARLLAVAPSSNVYDGDSQVGNDYFLTNGMWAENDWYLSNTGATAVIDRLSNIINEQGKSKHMVKLEGTLVSIGQNSSGDDDDNENNGDNLIHVNDSFSFDYSNKVGDFSNANSRPSIESNVVRADNKLILFNGFGSSANKMVGVTVNVSARDETDAYDRAMASSVRYAIFYHKVTYVGGQTVNEARTVFYNNDFTYFDGSVQKRAVSQNHCFQYQKDTEVKVTALIWLDGFADPRAESGAIDFSIVLHDYANVISNDISLSHGAEQNTFTVENCSDYTRENVVIPESIYMADGSTVARITKIGDNAFLNNENIISVVIPDSVTEIGENAFNGCANLSVVRLGSMLSIIKPMAFDNSGLEKCYFSNANNWYCGDIALNLNTLSNLEIASLLRSTNAELGGNCSADDSVWTKG